MIKAVWRLLPTPFRRWFWSRNPDFYIARSVRHSPKDAPLVVAGLFRSANGIGSSARATYRALKAAGLSPIAVDLTEMFVDPDVEPGAPLQPMPRNRQGVLILQLNAPEALRALRALGMFRGRAWRMIGYWAWELEAFPEGWDRAFRYFDEIWAVSAFTAAAIASHPAAPVVRAVPIPIDAPPPASGSDAPCAAGKARGQDGAFTVLAMADSLSSFERKNVVGAIRAFRQAFDKREDCKLIVKTRNIDRFPELKFVLERETKGARNIEIMDASLSHDAYWRLLRSINAYLSLHRAEGFAMPLAEAMSVGIPTVATRYSGNLDFMTDNNALLVDAAPTPVNDPYGVYKARAGAWANPNLEQASAHLVKLREDLAFADALGERARISIKERLSSDAIGSVMRDYLY